MEGEQDVGTLNPVPELIEEETLLDEVGTPGLPLEDFLRESALARDICAISLVMFLARF